MDGWARSFFQFKRIKIRERKRCVRVNVIKYNSICSFCASKIETKTGERVKKRREEQKTTPASSLASQAYNEQQPKETEYNTSKRIPLHSLSNWNFVQIHTTEQCMKHAKRRHCERIRRLREWAVGAVGKEATESAFQLPQRYFHFYCIRCANWILYVSILYRKEIPR